MLVSPVPDDVVPEESLGQYLMRAIEGFGDLVAIVDMQSKKELTFRQLRDQALEYTDILKRAGLRKGDIVGLVMPYELQYVPLYIAIINCGAVIFGTKLLYKASILKQLGGIKPLLTIVEDKRYKEISEDLKEHVPSVKLCMSFDEVKELKPDVIRTKEKCMHINEEINVHEDPVVIFQSSGTTGEPKGIITTHYGMVALIISSKAMSKVPTPVQITAGMVQNIIHVYSLGTLFMFLASGVKSAYSSDLSVAEFFEYVDEYKVNLYIITNVKIFKEILDCKVPDKCDLSSLKLVAVSGTTFPAHLIQLAREKFKIAVSIGYGMTECAVVCSSSFPNCPIESVGKPYPNVKVKVVDLSSGNELEANKKGEIWVQSPHSMKGYYLKEKESKTDGWIRSGDFGYYDENGFLYVVGRIKDIIKIQPGNVTVLPAELEAILVRHEKISDVAVVGVPHPDHGEVPKAFIVRNDESLKEEEVLKFFNSEVESITNLDGGVEFVDSLPRTELGKVQRRELLIKTAR